MRAGLLMSVLSLGAGMGAAMLAGAWLLACWAAGWNAPMPRDIGDVQGLIALRALWTAYLLGLPTFSAVGVISGLIGWREPAARLGVLLAASALVVFAISTASGFLLRA